MNDRSGVSAKIGFFKFCRAGGIAAMDVDKKVRFRVCIQPSRYGLIKENFKVIVTDRGGGAMNFSINPGQRP